MDNIARYYIELPGTIPQLQEPATRKLARLPHAAPHRTGRPTLKHQVLGELNFVIDFFFFAVSEEREAETLAKLAIPATSIVQLSLPYNRVLKDVPDLTGLACSAPHIRLLFDSSNSDSNRGTHLVFTSIKASLCWQLWPKQ